MIDPGNYRIGENMSNKSIKAIEKFVNENIKENVEEKKKFEKIFIDIVKALIHQKEEAV